MSLSVGTLMIDMAMNVAKMQQDMKLVQSAVDGGMNNIAGAVGKAKSAFAMLGVSLSVAGFTSWIKGAIDAAAHLYEVSEKTGVAASQLSALAAVGKLSETSVDSIAGGMLKLAKNMAVANEESKGTGQAIKALGLDFDTFKKMSPDQQMVAVAKAMDQFADGSGKSAVAMTLFGKSGAELLPFLHDLAEAGELNAKVTDEQALAAEHMHENMQRTKAGMESWKREMAMALLPALSEFADATAYASKQLGGTASAVKGLNEGNQLTEWARTAVTALTYVIDILGVLRRSVMTVIEFLVMELARATTFLSGMFGAIKQAISGDFSGAMDTMKSTFRQTDSIAKDFGQNMKEMWADPYVGAAMRKRIEEQRSHTAEVKNGSKAQLDFNARGEEGAKVAEKQAEAYRDLIKDLKTKRDSVTQEITQQKALTDAQKLEIETLAKLNDGKVKYTEAQRAAILKELEATKAAYELRDATKAQAEARKAVESVMTSQTNSLQQSIEKQKEENAAIGKTEAELARLEIARLNDAAATYLQQAALLDTIPGLEQEAKWYREQGEGLRKLAELKEQGIHVKAAQESAEAWKKTTDSIYEGLTDSLYRAFESGKGFMQAFTDTIKSVFANMVLRPTIEAVTRPISNLIGSIMQPITGALMKFVGTVVAAVSSAGTASATTSAVTGGGGGGMLSSLGSTLLSGVGGMTGLGSMFSTGVSFGMSGSLASTWAGTTGMLTSGTLGGTMTGLGSLIGSLGPYAAIAAAIAMIGNKMYGDGWTGNFGKDKYGTENQMPGTSLSDFLKNPIRGGMLMPAKWAQGALRSLGMSDKWSSILSGATLANWLFGRSAPRVTEQGLDLSFLGGEVEGSRYQKVKWEGGLFASTKRKTFTTPLEDEADKMFSARASAIFDATKLYASAIGAPLEALDNVTTAIKVKFTKDDEENQRLIEDAFEQYRQALAKSLGPALEAFQREGETLADTLERLTMIAGLRDELNQFGTVFSRIAQLSVTAQEELIGFAGGIEALIGKVQSFVGSYYTEAEQTGLAAQTLVGSLASIGIDPTGLLTKDDYRQLVESMDVSTTEGRKTLNALLDLAPAFAEIAGALGDGKSLIDLANNAPQMAVLTSIWEESVAASDVQQQTVDGVTRVADSVTAGTDAVVAAIEGMKAEVVAAVVGVASWSQQTTKLLQEWDNGGAMNVNQP
jgi:hypothetical protein